MRVVWLWSLGRLVLLGAWVALAAGIAYGQSTRSAGAEREEFAGLEELLRNLGDDDYLVREAATQEILKLGEAVEPLLREHLASSVDAEVRFRLRLILDNLRLPDRAALVVRADAVGQFEPGDLITHANNRPVQGAEDLLAQMRGARVGTMLRVRGANGLHNVGPLNVDDLPVLSDYRAPRGELVARVLRLYDEGYAERAYELLSELDGVLPENELSPLLRAVIAYTAGDGATAFKLLTNHPDACQPWSPANIWLSPSLLDLSGPGKAPFHLEWRLWTATATPQSPLIGGTEPDTAIQRVLVPAHRFQDALVPVAALWWLRYRETLGAQNDADRLGGNMLAVAAWMLSELDLWSECLRLVEPRSQILRRSSQGVRKWVRVRTDAWLPLARGDARAALDGFYEHAQQILQLPGPPARLVHIQNPRVAARIAFFLYQFPADERVAEMYNLLNQHEHPVLGEYARWMQHALCEENFDLIHEHTIGMLPNVTDEDAGELAWALALLEYASGSPDRQVWDAARERLGDAGADNMNATRLVLIDALEHLAHGRAAEALTTLERAAGAPGVAVLRSTAEFSASRLAVAAGPAIGQRPLLAVPLGREREEWLVLTRGRVLMRLGAGSDRPTRIEVPIARWFPGPLNWPWIGREESTGRVWLYGLRRVIEVCGREPPEFALNIRTEDIGAFDRLVGPVFSALNAATARVEAVEGETSELWRDDLQNGTEYFSDPALPELGLIHPLTSAERLVHVACRGGPHLLVDTRSGRCWSSDWIAGKLGLERPPNFLARVVQAENENGRVPVYLISDSGLIRFEPEEESLTRVALPGTEGYPAIVPEWCPYERRDQRWIYCARLPDDGGKVFRVATADGVVEALDMVNEALPRDYYAIQSRAALRQQIDEAFQQAGLPPLRKFIIDVERTVADYAQEERP
ncbi:MAG: hypothetical protein ABIG44_05885 [Planctomycetota bacterium]